MTNFYIRCLGRLFNKLKDLVAQKYPEQVPKIIGGFYFLRFFSPVTLSPKLHGLLDHDITAGCRRSLILCTKIIQNLSNNVKFSNEKYMVPFNDIVFGRQDEVKNFLVSLTDYENLKDEERSFSERVSETLFFLLEIKILSSLDEFFICV